MNLFSFFKELSEGLLQRATYPASGENIRKNIEFARILCGALSFVRYFDTFGHSIIVGDLQGWLLFASCLSLMLMVGLLTPLVVIISIFSIHNYYAYMWNLNSLVSIILLWVLFFMGAGKTLSFDFIIRKRLKRIYQYLYFFAVSQNEKNLAIIRVGAVALFWSLTFSAMSFHFRDELWLKGDILNLLMVTPYLSEYYFIFDYFQKETPFLYDVFCKVGMFIQGYWELALFPLIFFKWGYIFANLQGVGFFVICLLGVNVSYLPWQELFLWFALFHHPLSDKNAKKRIIYFDDRCNLCQKTIKFIRFWDLFGKVEFLGLSHVSDQRIKETEKDLNFTFEFDGTLYRRFDSYYYLVKHTYPFFFFFPFFFILKKSGIGERIYSYVELRRRELFGMCELNFNPKLEKKDLSKPISKKIMITFTFVAVFLSFVQAIVQIHVNFVDGSNAERHRRKFHNEFRAFGIDQVNVFNIEDMGMGDAFFVIAEVNKNNELVRVLPFMDRYGGRLNYLRNDFLYFNLSLLWQRTPRKRKYFKADDNRNMVNDHGLKIAGRVIDFDICLNQYVDAKRFKVIFFTREIEKITRGYKWSSPKYYQDYDIARKEQDNKKLSESYGCDLAFRMNPGHIFSRWREVETLEFLQEIKALKQ